MIEKYWIRVKHTKTKQEIIRFLYLSPLLYKTFEAFALPEPPSGATRPFSHDSPVHAMASVCVSVSVSVVSESEVRERQNVVK